MGCVHDCGGVPGLREGDQRKPDKLSGVASLMRGVL
jgi:hypothetical protein